MELAYEEVLLGKPGKKEYTVDALGREVEVRTADGGRFVNWYVCWAETEGRQLIVLAMVEDDGAFEEGSEVAAAPAVRHVIEAFYGVEQSSDDPFRTAEAPPEPAAAEGPS